VTVVIDNCLPLSWTEYLCQGGQAGELDQVFLGAECQHGVLQAAFSRPVWQHSGRQPEVAVVLI